MHGLILSRFSVTKTLRDDRACKTYIASDRWLGLSNVVVKIFRKGSFNSQIITQDRTLAGFASMRLQHVVPILDSGLTPDGNLYLVREYCDGAPAPSERGIEELRALISAVLFL